MVAWKQAKRSTKFIPTKIIISPVTRSPVSGYLTAWWKILSLVFYAGWVLANRTELPACYPDDEFEAARLSALKAIEAPKSLVTKVNYH